MFLSHFVFEKISINHFFRDSLNITVWPPLKLPEHALLKNEREKKEENQHVLSLSILFE